MEKKKRTALIFTFCTFVGLIVFLLVPKAPKFDFDLLGIVYLLDNIIPLTILAVTVFCGANAFYLWLKIWRNESES